jgi:hypothetical protein
VNTVCRLAEYSKEWYGSKRAVLPMMMMIMSKCRPQLPIKWVSVVVFSGVKRPGCEADHSPTLSDKFKNDGAILSRSDTS